MTALGRPEMDGDELLYACISKTLESGTTSQAASILLTLLNKYSFEPPEQINLPSLVRQVIPGFGLRLLTNDEMHHPTPHVPPYL